ncbi:MAG: primosomal protein N' [bacterium]
MSNHLAHVALNIPRENLFTYLIPSELEESVKPGHLVCVPLKKREEIGLVIDVNDAAMSEDMEYTMDLKEILALPYPYPVIDATLLRLARWISDYYLSPIGVTIRALIPTGLLPERSHGTPSPNIFNPRGKERQITCFSTAMPEDEILRHIASGEKKTPRQCTILKSIVAKGGKASITEIFPDGRVPYALIKKMINNGLLIQTRERAFRDPSLLYDRQKQYKDISLTPEQQSSLSHMCSALDQGGFVPFLLHGVTGSGKTEVYLRLILRALEKNLQAIVLVPEISITHQLIDRFRYYLNDRIAILHSHLSEGERLDEWLRIKQGLADVVIGARSAIFAPLSRLGVIVCDEEHDASYKQESIPKYHGRDVAIMRAKMTPCLICLGSATPSLESYYNTQIKKYHLLNLPKRVTPHPPPLVQIIDMKEEFYLKNREEDDQITFTKRLLDVLDETLRQGQQTILFKNRRGYSPFLLCPKCGYVPKCPNCSVSLTYHATDHHIRCHYCDYQNVSPEQCPHCAEVSMKYMGQGIQKVEQEIRKIFPNASVARMDRDTTSRKGAHYEILSGVERGDIDILIGTQMVTKGLDLPKVVTVGVIGIDHMLNLPDFRSTERVFQIITQVAGRAGRGDESGNVFVQTYCPHHYSLSFARNHDYTAFYNREIGFRKRLSYPPFTRLVCLIVKGTDRKRTRKASRFVHKAIKSHLCTNAVRVLGPAMAPLFRLRGKYRYQIMLKALDYRLAHIAVRKALASFQLQKEFLGMKVDVDIDPVNML